MSLTQINQRNILCAMNRILVSFSFKQHGLKASSSSISYTILVYDILISHVKFNKGAIKVRC